MADSLKILPSLLEDVPVLVKLARAVLKAPEPVTAIVPALVRVVIEHAPPMFSVKVAAFVNAPVPASNVVAVIVPLLVRMTAAPVTVSAVAHVNVPLFV